MRSTQSGRTDSPNNRRTHEGLTILSPRPLLDETIAQLGKIPSRSPGLETSQVSHDIHPLKAHSPPEPSTSAEPQLPSPSNTPAPLHITKTRLTRSKTPPARNGFEEVSLGGGESRADSTKHCSTEAPLSVFREVDKKLNPNFTPEPLRNPDLDRGVDEEFIGQTANDADRKNDFILNIKRVTTLGLVEGVGNGPYLGSDRAYLKSDAHASEQPQPRQISPNSKRTLQKTPSNMVERDRAQRRQGLALCGYILITTAIAIATVAFSLAVIAISGINKLRVPTATVTLPNGRNESSTSGSGLQSATFSTLAPSSALDWSGLSSRMRHASAKVTSPPSTRAIANMVPTEEMDKQDGCIKARGEASNGQKTTTITITSTISATPTSFAAPLSLPILSAPRSNIATRRFVAPLSWENLRWIVRYNTPPRPDASSSSFPVATANTINPPTEQLLHSAIANAATRRFALPWSSARRRDTTNPNPDAPMSNRTYTYWEAYSSVQLQVTQVCFAKETYLNRTLTPQIVRNAADDALAVALDEKMCKAGSGNATWSALPQGGRCEGKDKWGAMLEEVAAFCANGMESNILGQSVKVLRTVADERERVILMFAMAGKMRSLLLPQRLGTS
jgi:hypothetical protein